MKDKKKWIIGISACVLLMVSVFFVFNQGKSNEQVVTEYFELLKKKNYKQMYQMLNTKTVYTPTQKYFVEKYKEAFAKDPALRGKVELISKTGIYKQEINGESFGYYNTTYDRIVRSCKESLQRLHTDYLDLYLIHREDPLLDPWEAGRAMLDLKKEGLIKEIGVSNFDPFKFDAMNKAVDGALVTNQIEWNPVCFEHFNSGMMDYLTVNKIHPMIWSPLAGGRLFQEDDLQCKKAMDKIKEIAERHNCEPDTIVYAWIMYHPVQAMPIVGSRKVERIESAVKAMDVKLEHYEWYEIYAASGQQQIR